MNRFPKLWWKYVERYDEECEREDMEDCSTQSMIDVGIDPSVINKQVESSFVSTTYKDDITGEEKKTLDNNILKRNEDLKRKSGILLYPAVVVNSITYRGNLEAI